MNLKKDVCDFYKEIYKILLRDNKMNKWTYSSQYLENNFIKISNFFKLIYTFNVVIKFLCM